MTSLSPRSGGRVTIREVARHAGVGTKTVSRVVNDEPNVAPATAARVRASIAELRWEPDAHAANLRRSRSFLGDAQEKARSTGSAADRRQGRRSLAAAVAVHDDVVGEELNHLV